MAAMRPEGDVGKPTGQHRRTVDWRVMRAVLTAVIAAIEGLAIACAGLLIAVVPALLLWVVTFDLAAAPSDVFGSAVGAWFLAHLTPLELQVRADAAVSFGLPQEAIDFTIGLPLLGLMLLTVVLAVRSGWRFGRRGGSGIAGAIGGTLGFAAVAAAVVALADPPLTRTGWAAVLVAAGVYAVSATAAFLVRAARDEHPWWEACLQGLQRGIKSAHLPGAAAFPARAAATIRMAVCATAALFGLGAAALAVAVVAAYVQVMTLSQALQLDVPGAFTLLLLQFALLPVFIIWSSAWLSGTGFSIGVGTSASPFEALLGPMPALPLFGAIPPGWEGGGALAPILVVIAGVVVGGVFARRPMLRRASWFVILLIAACAGLLAGLGAAALGALATGSLGPERLQEAGPSPWLFGAAAAIELGIGLLLGVTAGRLDGIRARFGLAEAPAPGPDTQATIPLDDAVAGLASSERPRRGVFGIRRATDDPAHVRAEPQTAEPDFGSAETVELDPGEFETVELEHLETEPAEPESVPLVELDLHRPRAGEAADDASAEDAGGTAPEVGTPPEPELFDVEEVEAAEAAEFGASEQDPDAELLLAYSWDAIADEEFGAPELGAPELGAPELGAAESGVGGARGTDAEGSTSPRRRRGWPFRR